MDRVEVGERDRLDNRLGEKDVETRRVSDEESKKEVSAMLKEYDVYLSDRDDERLPPELEIYSGYRTNLRSPNPPLQPTLHPHAMDISSVRFRPVPVTAQAEMTSTQGHPRPNLPKMGKVNIGTSGVGFDVCREEEREREGRKREKFLRERKEFQKQRNAVSMRLNIDDLTNRGIEATIKEMDKEMNELKRKMREVTKTERNGDEAWGQKDKDSDRRRRENSGSDQKVRRVSQERVRARSRNKGG